EPLRGLDVRGPRAYEERDPRERDTSEHDERGHVEDRAAHEDAEGRTPEPEDARRHGRGEEEAARDLRDEEFTPPHRSHGEALEEPLRAELDHREADAEERRVHELEPDEPGHHPV